jgi:hypothetical protein
MIKEVSFFRFIKPAKHSNKIRTSLSAIALLALCFSIAAICGYLPLDFGLIGFITFFLASVLKSWLE